MNDEIDTLQRSKSELLQEIEQGKKKTLNLQHEYENKFEALSREAENG